MGFVEISEPTLASEEVVEGADSSHRLMAEVVELISEISEFLKSLLTKMVVKAAFKVQ